MKILFCSDPFDKTKVDENYAREYKSAKEQGLETALLHIEELIHHENANAATKSVKEAAEKATAIYRGWMLKPAQYEKLYAALQRKNIQLINTPEQYVHCHHLPEAYDLLKDHTPLSVWLDKSELDDSFANVHAALQIFGQAPIVVKDFVKSRKHEWLEACYIPDASDEAHVAQVTKRFLERQGDDLHEGVVFREFVELDFLAYHSQSGMPLSKEYRVFFLDGTPLFLVPYWEEGDYGELRPDLSPFLAVAKRVKSRFFTLDLAKRKDGGWIILEWGDGQVSGLPDRADVVVPFYEKIKLANIGRGVT